MVGTHIQEQLPSARDKGSSNKVLHFATRFILPIRPGFVKHHPYVSLDVGTMIQALRLYCGSNVCYSCSPSTTLAMRPGGSRSPGESCYGRIRDSKHREIVLQSMDDFFFAQGENVCYAARAFRNSRPTVIKWAAGIQLTAGGAERISGIVCRAVDASPEESRRACLTLEVVDSQARRPGQMLSVAKFAWLVFRAPRNRIPA